MSLADELRKQTQVNLNRIYDESVEKIKQKMTEAAKNGKNSISTDILPTYVLDLLELWAKDNKLDFKRHERVNDFRTGEYFLIIKW